MTTTTSHSADEGGGRRYTLLDRLLVPADQTLRTLFASHVAARPNPAESLPETPQIADNPAARRHAAGLMRVNHSGEVAAQALYQGQAFVSQTAATRASLMEAAREETDHLAWCAERIRELGGRTSVLNPLWYAGSFSIGALAGLAGDRISLGFVAETERQVVEHLDGHLQRLPADDVRTRAIIQQMSADEERHGRNAIQAGGRELPKPVRALMKLTAKVMTRTAYWL
ncbi:2-polyprenyl-3-methyl-6-methoxy-1,4-benzoquinone monooxygenase [Steroidobacter sp. S1-65]|uniref:3-demethoxyubiquinol 3-hydroxylase n=1 Tax=Steroidobacter gossypii TaxID=2805490 RepID=A0ABS1X5B1_9GAMM|nr:2-polyprenyl-3-methyl-6-methoxy-1,4-benzoquinone monooxygenase [Steroidobacter gossypii]MBM0108412.1 2-polyprenyl-3-methyl-6-methoxy-1,4-benzoquinone monooxygenase [Steroidobacter gossypii]